MGNLWTVLTSPTATFERLRANRVFWVPMIVLIVLSAFAVWLQLPALVAELEKGIAETNVPAEALQGVQIFAQVTGVVSAAFMVPVGAFITGLLLLLVNLIVRGEAQYMQLATVGLYAYVPAVISQLIIGILVRVTGATSVYDVALNLSAFKTEKTGFLFHFLTLVDPFAIWSLVLTIIGTAVMAQRPRKKVATWIVLGYVLMCLVVLLIAAAGEKMSGV